jgi:hypothetical protein
MAQLWRYVLIATTAGALLCIAWGFLVAASRRAVTEHQVELLSARVALLELRSAARSQCDCADKNEPAIGDFPPWWGQRPPGEAGLLEVPDPHTRRRMAPR